LAAWSIPALVLVVSYDVSMRFLFHRGSVALQELEWHLFSLVFLLGAAHTLRCGQHVRLDLCYRSRWLNDRRRAWIDLLGGLFFLAPFCVLVIVSSWDFVSQSFVHAEGSPDPGGLPYRWLLKAAIPFGFGLLLLQGVADILGNLRRLFLEIQIQMALADGAVSAPERRILLLVSDCLGIPRALYRRLEEQIRASAHSGPAAGSGPSLEDAYATLGVPSGASETEVKRAYRRLMSRHHPDKLVAKGLPEEMMRVATERTQEIRAAYDRIKEARA